MSSGNKITDLINSGEFTYSFEVTPNISLEQIDGLPVDPTFYSITWHAKTHLCDGLVIGPVKLACELKKRGKEVLLHLSCDLLTSKYLDDLLQILEEKGICNLFLVLGENFEPSKSEFQNSNTLIKYIRKRTGQFFCLGIAGFPDKDRRLTNLKEKIDSGADYIITQAFFEFNSYKNFVEKCKDMSIKVPIIPGIFFYKTHKQLTAFANVCKVKVSKDLLEFLESNETISGTETVMKLVLDLRDGGFGTNHYHFFTLNKLDGVNEFITNLRQVQDK